MMKKLKSYILLYSKGQRIGVFALLVLIIILQIVLFSLNNKSNSEKFSLEEQEFQNQIDSLKRLKLKDKKPKIYPFNPNFITDFKGYQLGMSVGEIDRLHKFRNQNKWINSAKQFKEITKISDTLFLKISPYFKFPDWVTNPKKKKFKKFKKEVKKVEPTTNDLNKATVEDLKIISGVGDKLSERIIKYRTKLQGFNFENQLYEVWGLDKQIAEKILGTFKIIEKLAIKKVNVNTASFKEVLRTPYVDYELCKKIFDYRDEVAELQNISELKNIKDFPLDKYEKIVLYLEAR